MKRVCLNDSTTFKNKKLRPRRPNWKHFSEKNDDNNERKTILLWRVVVNIVVMFSYLRYLIINTFKISFFLLLSLWMLLPTWMVVAFLDYSSFSSLFCGCCCCVFLVRFSNLCHSNHKGKFSPRKPCLMLLGPTWDTDNLKFENRIVLMIGLGVRWQQVWTRYFNSDSLFQ